jgi:3-oxoacyl-[acyl-carrier-protein] synthase III
MFTTRFLGLGGHLPARRVSNEELAPKLGITPDWIVTRCGVEARRYCEPHQATSDLALEAAKEALEEAKLKPEELDLIIFATLSPDHEFPGSGFFFQHKLKAKNVPVFDLRAQCSGFVYGLSIADKFIRCGEHSKVLLVGAEVHSKGLDFTESAKHITVLFGDGAGAIVLGRGEEGSRFVRATQLHADGKFAKALWIPGPGSGTGRAERLDEQTISLNEHHPQMDGPQVFLSAIHKMTEVVQSLLKREGLTVADVDLFVMHQANLRILERVAQNLDVPMTRFHNTIAETANTTAASIPLGLVDARKAGKLTPGTRVMCATFGAGFTWSAALLNF